MIGNYPEPHKRPLSSTAPTIIERQLSDDNWDFYIAIGASGGSKIFPAIAQVILGIDAWGLDASTAIEAGRVHDQLYPSEVEVDEALVSAVGNSDSEDVVGALRERGHNVTGMFSISFWLDFFNSL